MWHWLKIEVTPPEFDQVAYGLAGIGGAALAISLLVYGHWFSGLNMTLLTAGCLFHALRRCRSARPEVLQPQETSQNHKAVQMGHR